jgi:hypothetical protein
MPAEEQAAKVGVPVSSRCGKPYALDHPFLETSYAHLSRFSGRLDLLRLVTEITILATGGFPDD